MKSDLGITPANDGNVIRLAIPQLTERTAQGTGPKWVRKTGRGSQGGYKEHKAGGQ